MMTTMMKMRTMSKGVSMSKNKKPKTVTCPECGMTYDSGAPHGAFCSGTKETVCSKCNAKTDGEDSYVVKCKECGNVFCEECGDTTNKVCLDCEDDVDDVEE